MEGASRRGTDGTVAEWIRTNRKEWGVVLFEWGERGESTDVYKQAVQVDRKMTKCMDDSTSSGL